MPSAYTRPIIALCIVAFVPVGSTFKSRAAVPEADRCRLAVKVALDELRLQRTVSPRHEERRKQLLAELERMVESNRRQGLANAGRGRELWDARHGSSEQTARSWVEFRFGQRS